VASENAQLTTEEEKMLGYNRRLIEQCRDIVRRVSEAATAEKRRASSILQLAAPTNG